MSELYEETISSVLSKSMVDCKEQMATELDRRIREAIQAIDPSCTNDTLRDRLSCYVLSDGTKEYYFDKKPLFGTTPPKIWMDVRRVRITQDYYPLT